MAIPQKYPLLTLLKLEQANAAYLRRMLEETAKTVEKQLKALDKGGVSSEVTRMQLEAQRASIKGYLKQDFNKVEDVVRLGQKEAAAAASRVVSRYEQLLQGMVMTPQMMKQIADNEALRAANGIEAALRRMEKTSFVPLAKQVYMTEKLASGWVDDQINQALIKGSTWKELANAISGSINPNVPGGVSYAAERLARTEINNAFHASAAKRFQESNLTEAVEWHLSTSHPEGDICDSLAADGPYDPEKIPRKPHPHCYCYITPVLPEEEAFFNNLFNGKYDEDPMMQEASLENIAKAWNSESILSGTARAEQQRVKLEGAMYDSKGNYNAAAGWNSKTSRSWNSYTQMGHADMNSILRDPRGFAANPANADWIETVNQQVDDMIDLISKNRLTEDIVVGRGVTVSSSFNPATLKSGDMFADPAFLSTTTNMAEAAEFAAGRGAGAEGWTFVTKAPKGTNAVAGADYQNEIVFGPGQMQRVVGVDVKTRTIYTEMTS